MGKEINATGFTAEDFAEFRSRLATETSLICALHKDGRLSREGPRVGFEIEAWLIDRNCFPAPDNGSFLARIGDPMVVAELSRFNIELNGNPRMLAGDGLAGLEQDISRTLKRCCETAHADVDTVVAIGTLPTLRESDLSLANMTPSNRYVALNREVFKARGEAPIQIDIESVHPGHEHLRSTHDDVMLEAAATSFQLHYQVPIENFAQVFNASIMASAPIIALAANSPFLFGRALWHETRIPVFEQALEGADGNGRMGPSRVTFGSGYVGDDPCQLFSQNHADFPVLLPILGENDPEQFECLSLHNGTIWRWNRQLVGFDTDGTVHLRLEHRIMPAGPSVIDMMANAAFFYGLAHGLAEAIPDAEAAVPFARARANFYAAARNGLDAEITWLDGEDRPARKVLAELLPLARKGLEQQQVSESLIDRYLDIVEMRIASGRNGAAWQLAHHARYKDLFRLTADYLEHQRSGAPVHEWPL